MVVMTYDTQRHRITIIMVGRTTRWKMTRINRINTCICIYISCKHKYYIIYIATR